MDGVHAIYASSFTASAPATMLAPGGFPSFTDIDSF
jgi:hypothetical protein